jgi:predicted dehydrogenase
MRFALLGNDPDGVEMACALVDSGHHQLAAFSAPVPDGVRKRWNLDARKVGDAEEALADSAVDLVVVAGKPFSRSEQLRRALQSERHALCVRPAELSIEAAYEAALLQGDAGTVLLPLMPASLHPGIRRLAGLAGRGETPASEGEAVGALVLVEVELESVGEVLIGLDSIASKPAFPGWDLLRALGGEIDEVSAFAEQEELQSARPVLVAGRFNGGGLLRMTLLARRPASSLRLAAFGSRGKAELYFPLGWEGPAFLTWQGPDGEDREESWERWDPWPALVEVLEDTLARRPPNSGHVPELLREAIASAPAAPRAARRHPAAEGRLTWQDAVRALELDDAARRSVEKRRASALEYQQATEEVGFKGTMTLIGCGMVWAVLLLLILSVWVPAAKYIIVGLLVVFLGMQLLRYVIPSSPSGDAPPERDGPAKS